MTDKVAAEGLVSPPASQLDLHDVLGEVLAALTASDMASNTRKWLHERQLIGRALAEIRRLAEVSSPVRPQLVCSAIPVSPLRVAMCEAFAEPTLINLENVAMAAQQELREGAVSAAPPALKHLVSLWRRQAGQAHSSNWEDGRNVGIKMCADELAAALADLARLRAPREEQS